MANCQAETGFQLFARLSTRPDLLNIYPALIPNFGPKGREVIEITGESSAGKTFLASELIANCLLPDQEENFNIGGKNAGAIILNTDHHFHIFKLISIMESMLKKCRNNSNSLTSVQINSIINKSLQNLVILNCFDSQQLFVTIHNLENIISGNNRIALLVLDSLSAYYWTDRLSGGIQKMDLYQKTILKLLQNMTKDYSLIIVFTKYSSFTSKKEVTEECCKQATLEKINYRIVLEKVKNEPNKFCAHVKFPDNSMSSRFYNINKLIDWDD